MLFRDFDAFDGLFENTFALDRNVMVFLHAIEVHIEEEAGIGPKFFDLLADEHTIRTKNDVLTARHDLRHEATDFRIEHRLAATYGDGGGAAFIDGFQALFNAEALRNSALVFADATATSAGEVAGMQRLEHKHKREALVDHGMHEVRIFSGPGVHDDLERIGGIVADDVLLPLRRRAELVLCYV